MDIKDIKNLNIKKDDIIAITFETETKHQFEHVYYCELVDFERGIIYVRHCKGLEHAVYDVPFAHIINITLPKVDEVSDE